jgi:hypothetical protein
MSSRARCRSIVDAEMWFVCSSEGCCSLVSISTIQAEGCQRCRAVDLFSLASGTGADRWLGTGGCGEPWRGTALVNIVHTERECGTTMTLERSNLRTTATAQLLLIH